MDKYFYLTTDLKLVLRHGKYKGIDLSTFKKELLIELVNSFNGRDLEDSTYLFLDIIKLEYLGYDLDDCKMIKSRFKK